MPDIVTLEEAKAHCRIDHAEDDAILTQYIATAAAFVMDKSGLSVLIDTETATPANVKQAALLMISALYDNRGESDFKIPQAIYSLLSVSRLGI